MLRFYLAIVRNLFRLPGVIRKMNQLTKSDRYSDEERYDYLKYIVGLMQKTGPVQTEIYGTENLPKEGGYIMYPNHQGRYDVFGIVAAHKKACTVVMDMAKSNIIFIRELLDLVKGKRLDKQDLRQQFGVMNEIAQEVKLGRRYVIFPEGWYDDQKKNTLIEFKAGCFKASVKSATPIVPVALIDSYKPFNSNILGMVTTQVHFLNAISYEEYKGLQTKQIAEMVKERIQTRIDEVTCRTADI